MRFGLLKKATNLAGGDVNTIYTLLNGEIDSRDSKLKNTTERRGNSWLAKIKY